MHSECHQISHHAARPLSDMPSPPFSSHPQVSTRWRSTGSLERSQRPEETVESASGTTRTDQSSRVRPTILSQRLSLAAEVDRLMTNLVSPRRRPSAKPTDRLHPHSNHVSRLQPHAHTPRRWHVVRLEQRTRRQHPSDADEGPTAHRQAGRSPAEGQAIEDGLKERRVA